MHGQWRLAVYTDSQQSRTLHAAPALHGWGGRSPNTRACPCLSPLRLLNLRCYLQLYRCDSCPTVSCAKLSPKGAGGTVLCPFTFYILGWVLMINAQSFQHHIASQAVLPPAIWVPRKRLSMLKNDPHAHIWHSDYTNLCNNWTCRTVLGECCTCWEQVHQFPRTSRTSISLFQINLTSESTTDKSRRWTSQLSCILQRIILLCMPWMPTAR